MDPTILAAVIGVAAGSVGGNLVQVAFAKKVKEVEAESALKVDARRFEAPQV